MTAHDVFELRAAAAGAALRRAFEDDAPVSSRALTGPEQHVPDPVLAGPVRRRPARGLLVAAAAVVGTVGALVLLPQPSQDRAEVLVPATQPPGPEPSPRVLVAAGTLPEAQALSVRDVPVPFDFTSPPRVDGAPPWRYRVVGAFEVGNLRTGLTVLGLTQTYDPLRPWAEQTELVPAPVDAAGWADWLATAGAGVVDRQRLQVDGLQATRFVLDVGDLPEAYACGGGRRCLALAPMTDPQAGPSGVGRGPQVGIEPETVELTVVELPDRAVLVLATGPRAETADWLPALRSVAESLRFP